MHKWQQAILVLCLTSTAAFAALPDPTMPANYDASTLISKLAKDISLDAIVYSPDRQVAIINGQSLSQGDTIKNFQVLAIKPQAVLLKGPYGTFELPLTTAIKQPANNRTNLP